MRQGSRDFMRSFLLLFLENVHFRFLVRKGEKRRKRLCPGADCG
jgi:hypothetical protein